MAEKKHKEKIELRLKWDVENSSLLTKKLFSLVEDWKAKVNIKAKPGSLELVIIVTILVESYPILKDIKDWIKNRRQSEELPTVEIRRIRRIITEEEIEKEEI